MAEKVTIMVLKVDLQCCKCYKKVKKVLCKFPQIQDQVYDEKNNKVVIKVIGCCPEKIRDKLCCKGKGCIKSIEILEPPKPQPPPPKPPPPEQPPPPKPQPPPPQPEQPPPPKPQPPPPQPEQPPPPKPQPPPPQPEQPPPPKPQPPPPQPEQPPPPKPQPPPPKPQPPPPAVCPVPVGFCCSDCYEGRGGGPCNDPCYGRPIRYYDGYCGRPVYDSWGGGCGCGCRGYYGCRCREYYCQDNSQGCTIM